MLATDPFGSVFWPIAFAVVFDFLSLSMETRNLVADFNNETGNNCGCLELGFEGLKTSE